MYLLIGLFFWVNLGFAADTDIGQRNCMFRLATAQEGVYSLLEPRSSFYRRFGTKLISSTAEKITVLTEQGALEIDLQSGQCQERPQPTMTQQTATMYRNAENFLQEVRRKADSTKQSTVNRALQNLSAARSNCNTWRAANNPFWNSGAASSAIRNEEVQTRVPQNSNSDQDCFRTIRSVMLLPTPEQRLQFPNGMMDYDLTSGAFVETPYSISDGQNRRESEVYRIVTAQGEFNLGVGGLTCPTIKGTRTVYDVLHDQIAGMHALGDRHVSMELAHAVSACYTANIGRHSPALQEVITRLYTQMHRPIEATPAARQMAE